jgi:hypothetical protein
MGFGTRKNIHIENWAAFRENCEYSFKFNRANWARFFVFGIGVPVLAYVVIATDMVCLKVGCYLCYRPTNSNYFTLIAVLYFKNKQHKAHSLRRCPVYQICWLLDSFVFSVRIPRKTMKDILLEVVQNDMALSAGSWVGQFIPVVRTFRQAKPRDMAEHMLRRIVLPKLAVKT